MLPITDLNGNTELLTNVKGLTRTRKVNGDKTLSFFVIPDKSNEHSYSMVDTESIVEFDGEEYIIKLVGEKDVGKKTIKQVEAIHKFFNDMLNAFQYKLHNGSMTFLTACQFVFENTAYSFNVIDSFLAESFQNFGRSNCLSLFQTILERFGAEFRVIGNTVFLEKEIGNKTDFQYRYAHNIKTIDKQMSTKNLATIIRGYGGEPDDNGNYPIEEEYTSPNIDKFGELHADAAYDERITTVEGMQERLQKVLIDEPQLSITIDIVDLRASGYNFNNASEGDYGFIVYEPMDNLDIEARIVEIVEEYDGNLKQIKTNVTLSNLRETSTDDIARFSQTSKTLDSLMNGQGKLPYNVLDEAVRRATEAIQSAQTELDFTNGITGVDPDNPNYLTRFTSRGIGVSSDGGATFPDAIVRGQINTSLLAAGQIQTNNIQIIGIDDLFYWDGNALMAIDPNNLNKFARLRAGELYISRGAYTIERPDGYKVVNDGISSLDYSVSFAMPDFMESGVSKSGIWYTQNTTSHKEFCYFSVKHTARYLKFVVFMKVSDASEQVSVKLTDAFNGVDRAFASSSAINSGGEVREMIVDLGVPTGGRRAFYGKFRSVNSNSNVYVRILQAYLEG